MCRYATSACRRTAACVDRACLLRYARDQSAVERRAVASPQKQQARSRSCASAPGAGEWVVPFGSVHLSRVCSLSDSFFTYTHFTLTFLL